MTTSDTSDKPLPAKVVTSLEEAPDALPGGPDLVPVYAYRNDGIQYQIQMSPKAAKAGGYELVNPPPKPKAKARKPKTTSRSKATAKDKAKTPDNDKTPAAGSK